MVNNEGHRMKKILEVFGEPILNGGQESFVFKERIDKNI